MDTRRLEPNIILSIVYDIPTRRVAPRARFLPGGARRANIKADTAAYPKGEVSSSVLLSPCFRANPYAVMRLSASGLLLSN